MPPSRPVLLSIVAHARSGALDHAWRLFREAGLEVVADEPAVLNVRGRLLKDRAVAAAGAERKRLYREAAEAYAQAGALSGTTYPLINAASLSLLAGAADLARARAEAVLARLDGGEGEPDTPYYQEATRAEALLVMGQVDAARASLAVAVALAPRAWEDHASTLRQFALILEALGEDAGWLVAHRPPRTLHFAGHMAVDADEDGLRDRIAEALDATGAGIGFGALAAGADILIAEALLARGGLVHVILPAPEDAFRAASVARYGADWGKRFDRIVDSAETLRAVAHAPGAAHPLAIRLAAEVAMGAAVAQARTLCTEATQLLVLDDAGPAGASDWMRGAWALSGRPQRIVAATRSAGAASTRAPDNAPDISHDAAWSLAAVLAVQLERTDDDSASKTMRDLAQAIGDGPLCIAPPRWSGEGYMLAYAHPSDAAAAALALMAHMQGGARIAGHYGVMRKADDPLGGGAVLLGQAASTPARILASTPPDAIQVSEDFACALYAGRPDAGPRTQYVGDLTGPDLEDDLRLFSLRA